MTVTASKLPFAPGLSLPVDVVTQRLAFLGRIGSGKSYAATKLAELLLTIGAQVVAIDPVGVWYGLRVDGKGKGFPIPVFGGLHGDVPLDPSTGAMIADLIIDRRLSCVIDISQFEHDSDKARFITAFAARFFFRKKAAPSAVHIFWEECQEFFPQQPAKGEERMVHSCVRMAKIGRNFGIGMSLVSQRPQEVSKKALNLTECMFAFQVRGKHERLAMKDWVSATGADATILDELPQLPVGVAHVDSPQWLRISEKVKCFEKRTADVSSTPEFDADPVAAKPLTAVDLDELRGAMVATIEKAKQEDPKLLREQLAALKRDNRDLSAALDKQTHAPVLAKTLDEEYRRGLVDGEQQAISRALTDINARNRKSMANLRGQLSGYRTMLGDAVAHLDLDIKSIDITLEQYAAEDSRADVQVGNHEKGTGANHPSAKTGGQQSRSTTRPPVASTPPSDAGLSRSAQKLLDAAARLASVNVETPTRVQLAALARISSTSSTTDTSFGVLTKGGYLENAAAGAVRLTVLGRRHAAPVDTPPTLREYHEEWRRILGTGTERKLFEAYLGHPKTVISRLELNEEAGVSSTSSTTDTAYGKLTGLGLFAVAGKGDVKDGPTLFPEGLD